MTFLLSSFALLTLTAFVTLVTYLMASAPNDAPSYLGPRGLRRSQALSKNPFWEHLEPLVRWMATRLKPFFPKKAWEALDRQITASGDFWGLTPGEFVALSVVSLASGAVFGGIYGIILERGSLYILLGAVLGGALPYLQLSGLEQQRRRQVQNGLPYVIDLLSLGLSAGLDFVGALRQVVEKTSTPDDPLIEELNLILQEIQVGKTRREALSQFAERVPSETVREFAGSIIQAEERGNPLAEVLHIQAESTRQRRSVRAEEAASKASLQILAPMLLVFVAILLLIVAPMALELSKSFGEP